MKTLILATFLLMPLAQAKIEVCHRKAQIAFGLVDHYWLKTDAKNAGMGSGNVQGQIGDQFEGPGTKVFVIDHTDQIPESCEETTNHIEECIDNELELGKSIGRFSPLNNCQTYVKRVLRKCETPEYTILRKEKAEQRKLSQKRFHDRPMTVKEELRLRELDEKYGDTL